MADESDDDDLLLDLGLRGSPRPKATPSRHPLTDVPEISGASGAVGVSSARVGSDGLIPLDTRSLFEDVGPSSRIKRSGVDQEDGQGTGTGRGQRKRARPSYLDSYDEGANFDASQPCSSQIDLASPSAVADAPKNLHPPELPVTQQAASPNSLYLDLDADSPPRPQRKRGGRGRTEEEKAAAAAAKELEKQQKKEARERAKAEKAAFKEEEKRRKAEDRLDRQRSTGKTALEDTLPVLCPGAVNHATTLRIMDRLQAESLPFEVSSCGALPLGSSRGGRDCARKGLRSMLWKRRIHKRPSPLSATNSQGAGGAAEEVNDGSPAHDDIPYVLVYITGEELVSLLDADSLDGLLSRVAAAHPGFTLGLLVEGFHSYLRRRQNAEYRALGPAGGGFNASRYEDVLARLTVDQPGVRHRCVADAAQAADHVCQLTKALANQPFKVQDSFLNQFGGSGKGTCSVKATLARFPLRSVSLDPWYQALSYVVDISPPQAHSIVHQHPSLGHLIAIYLDPTRSNKEKENLVADLKIAGGSQRVGPKASQRLFALFTATDPLMPLGDLGFNG